MHTLLMCVSGKVQLVLINIIIIYFSDIEGTEFSYNFVRVSFKLIEFGFVTLLKKKKKKKKNKKTSKQNKTNPWT